MPPCQKNIWTFYDKFEYFGSNNFKTIVGGKNVQNNGAFSNNISFFSPLIVIMLRLPSGSLSFLFIY